MNIGIVGLGLIGGSLGLDLRCCGHRIWGVSRQAQTCEWAVAHQVVDQASVELSSLADPDLDLVIICTPIPDTLPTLDQVIHYLSPQVVVSDVASVKGSLVRSATQCWPQFVGGHPMAGTAAQGIRAAQSDLFQQRPYVLTPLPETSEIAIGVMKSVIQDLGARLVICHPDDHDRAVAWISHLPVMVSASLIAAVGESTDPTILSLAQQLASSGFRDTSRVGGGNPDLGVAMAQYNQQALLQSLKQYQHQLDQTIQHIEAQDWDLLHCTLSQAQQTRQAFHLPEATGSG